MLCIASSTRRFKKAGVLPNLKYLMAHARTPMPLGAIAPEEGADGRMQGSRQSPKTKPGCEADAGPSGRNAARNHSSGVSDELMGAILQLMAGRRARSRLPQRARCRAFTGVWRSGESGSARDADFDTLNSVQSRGRARVPEAPLPIRLQRRAWDRTRTSSTRSRPSSAAERNAFFAQVKPQQMEPWMSIPSISSACFLNTC